MIPAAIVFAVTIRGPCPGVYATIRGLDFRGPDGTASRQRPKTPLRCRPDRNIDCFRRRFLASVGSSRFVDGGRVFILLARDCKGWTKFDPQKIGLRAFDF